VVKPRLIPRPSPTRTARAGSSTLPSRRSVARHPRQQRWHRPIRDHRQTNATRLGEDHRCQSDRNRGYEPLAAHWRERGPQPGRRIVNITSGVGLTPPPGNPPYVAAKAGVAALTIACAIELAELGVRVNRIAPVARTRISQVVAPDQMKAFDNRFDQMAPTTFRP
jgi:NAD(P)-dependent dehydrogenase (short-subunit alcohol dehydrogenase family)